MTEFGEEDYELDLGAERQDLLFDLNRAIRSKELTEARAVEILSFYELYKKLEALGGDVNPN